MKSSIDLPTHASSMPKPLMPAIPTIDMADVKPARSLETKLMAFRAFVSQLKSEDRNSVDTSDFKYFIEWNKTDYEQNVGRLPSDWDIDRILCFSKEITVYTFTDSTDLPSAFQLIIDIAYSNKTKQVFHVISREDVNAACQYISSIGTSWKMLMNVQRKKLNWQRLDRIYAAQKERDIHFDYQRIHRQMLVSLVPGIVSVLAKRQQNKQPLEFNIIDAGCGLAPQLLIGARLLIKALNEQYFDVPVAIKGLGFDFEKVNSDWCAAATHALPECVKIAAQSPDVIFLQGNSFDLESIVKEGGKFADAKPHLHHTENTYTMGLSSGSFTRATLGSGFDGARVLQACWLAPVDQLVLGGETEFLFVRRMLKRIGYRITRTDLIIGPDVPSQPIITLQRLSIDEIAKQLVNKINRAEIKPIHLDLSMSPCPEVLLDKIIAGISDRVMYVKSIDLSFSKITDVEALVALLKKLPPALTVTYYCNDPSLLSHLLLHIPSTLQLDIRYTANEFTLAHSKKLLERTGRGHEFTNDPPVYRLLTTIANELHRSGLECSRIASIYTELLSMEQQGVVKIRDRYCEIVSGSLEKISHNNEVLKEEKVLTPIVQENKTAQHDRVLRQYITKEDCGNQEKGHLLSNAEEIYVRETFAKDPTLTKLSKSDRLRYSVIKNDRK